MTKLSIGVINEALPIDAVAQQMLAPARSLDWHLSNAFLSHRQFDRKFIDRMGIPPKEYLRVVRLIRLTG